MAELDTSRPPSRPFDVHRWSDYKELDNCLTALVGELEQLEGRQRRRSAGEKKHFREAIRCLVLDLYVAWKTDPELLVAVPLGNRSYTTKSRYRALFLHWSSFNSAYDALVQAGYIAIVLKGYKDRETGIGRITRIRGTEKLIHLLTQRAALTIPHIARRLSEHEVIILRGQKPTGSKGRAAPLVEYDDTEETNAMRANVHRINDHLQRQWIDLRITDEDFGSLQRRMQADYDASERERPTIDLTQRGLVRIFNNGRWDHGGRFYRGWWQSIPKEYRQHITINDKRTGEVDYSTLHPTLLYVDVGGSLVGDAYDIEDPAIPRSLVKTTFNKMLNATGGLSRPDDFSEDRFGMSWKKLQDAIAERHAPIKHLFNTGYGLRLQRLDSDLAETVMLRFVAHGHTCLPVHDSFIVHHALVNELKKTMVDVFKDTTGRTISVKDVEGFEPELDADYQTGEHAVEPTESWFHATGDYTEYEQRKIDWYSHEHMRRVGL